jgi:multiple sugar transport system substrate-binding protein
MTWDHPRGKAPLVGLGERSGTLGETVVDWSARSLQAFADYPLDELAATYDLLVVDHPHVPAVAREGLLVPLDEHLPGEVLARLSHQSVGASYESYVDDGHGWALPIDAAAQVSVHRPDLLSDLPVTWDDVLELARDARVLWPTKPVDAMSSFLTLVAQSGGTVCATAEAFVDRALGLAVLELMCSLSELVPPACLDEDPIATAERLTSGDLHCYAPLAFGYVNYSREGFRAHQLAYRDIPSGARGVAGSCLGGAGIAVSARSAHRPESVDVAAWLASAEVQSGEYYELGGQPANSVAGGDAGVNASCLDFFTGTRATLDGASLRPREPSWLALQDVVGQLVHDTLAHRLDRETCLDRLDRAWQDPAGSSGAGPLP